MPFKLALIGKKLLYFWCKYCNHSTCLFAFFTDSKKRSKTWALPEVYEFPCNISAALCCLDWLWGGLLTFYFQFFRFSFSSSTRVWINRTHVFKSYSLSCCRSLYFYNGLALELHNFVALWNSHLYMLLNIRATPPPLFLCRIVILRVKLLICVGSVVL